MRARAAWAAIILGLIGVCIAKGLLEQVNVDSSDARINCDVPTVLASLHDSDFSSDRWIGGEDIKKTGRMYLRGEGEAIIPTNDYVEGNYWHAPKRGFFPFIKIFWIYQSIKLSFISIIWEKHEPWRTCVLSLTGQGFFSQTFASLVHFLGGIHVWKHGKHRCIYPSFQRWRQPDICQNEIHWYLGRGIEGEWPRNTRIHSDPWATGSLHFVQLAFHGRQLTIANNRLRDSDPSRDNSKNSDYPGGIGSYSGRPFLGGLLLALGAALLKIAFYFGDTPRPDWNDRWLAWGTGVTAAVMICQGTVLALVGIWLF